MPKLIYKLTIVLDPRGAEAGMLSTMEDVFDVQKSVVVRHKRTNVSTDPYWLKVFFHHWLRISLPSGLWSCDCNITTSLARGLQKN